MAAIKSDSNQDAGTETLSDSELIKRLNHIDDLLHRIDQRTTGIADFIDEHRPALARGLSLMDPGAKLRGAFGMKPKGNKRDDTV